MMRLGHYRAVHVKSKASQLLRTTLIARKKFVDHMLAIEDTIRGLMKVHGLKLGVGSSQYVRGGESRPCSPMRQSLRTAIEPLLEARNMMRRQKVLLDRQLAQMARKDDVCKRLMTISGVGPLVSLSFKATIDDPKRFKDSKAVAAHLGLTPRVYQSGEIDRSGNISKCGDKLMRHALYEAANSHMRISKKWSALRAWGVKLAKRIGIQESVRGRCSQARDYHASNVGRRKRTSGSASRLSPQPHRDRSGVAICSAEDVGKVSPFRSLCGARIEHVL